MHNTIEYSRPKDNKRMSHLYKDILGEIASYIKADIHRLFFDMVEGAVVDFDIDNITKSIFIVNRADLCRLVGAAPAVCRLWRAIFGPLMALAREHFHMTRVSVSSNYYCQHCNNIWCLKDKPIKIKSISSARGISVIQLTCNMFEIEFNMGVRTVIININVPYTAVIGGRVDETYNQSTISFNIKNTNVPRIKDNIKSNSWYIRKSCFTSTTAFEHAMERFKDKYGSIIEFFMPYAINSGSGPLHVKPFKFNYNYRITGPSVIQFVPLIMLARDALGWPTLTYQTFGLKQPEYV